MNVSMIAHNQWASRPEDERVATLHDAYKLAKQRYDARQIIPAGDLRVVQNGENLAFANYGENLGQLNFHSLDQLAHYTGYPARIATKLKERPELVADSFNTLLAQNRQAFKVWRDNATNVARGLTTDKFGHIFDLHVVQFLLELSDNETNKWHRPKAYTDEKYPSGYYMSEKDCFFIIANDDAQIDDGGMGMGVIVSNSEVGDSKALLGLVFGYKYICGNHMIWGFEEKAKWKVIHKGDKVQSKFADARRGWAKMTLEARTEYERVIGLARKKFLPNVETVTELLTAKRVGYTQKATEQIVAYAIERNWNPTNVYSLWDSATTLSHGPYQDSRMEADVRAAKILQLA